MTHFYAEDLAYCHHVGFADPLLPSAIIDVLRAHGVMDGTVVDLGCNGGHLLAALLERGYAAVGIDVSDAALEIAAREAPGAAIHHCDAQSFEWPECAAVTALGEVLCYAPDGGPDTLADDTTLARIHQALAPGGLLLFDIIVQDDTQIFRYRNRRDGGDWVLEHAVSEDIIRRRLRRDIVLDRRVKGTWRRSRETHHLVLHPTADIVRRLRALGFDVTVSDRFGSVRTLPRRVAFICRKSPC